MRIFIAFAFMSFAILGSLGASADKNEFFKVKRVVDGDTVDLEKIGKVRLIGVDTPETKDPRKPVQYFGKEATQNLKTVLSGKKVRIEYDQTKKDRYDRTLGYLYLEDGTFVNKQIIKNGFGFAYTKYPFKYMEDFRAAERQAREAMSGMWAKEDAAPTIKQPVENQKIKNDSKFECVKKTCGQISTCAEAIYLLNECGFGRLDGDKDGAPCEKLCN